MNDAIDQLFAILREVGATPTLYGNPVTADAPREPEWSPYL